ncbi:MAG TPA: enoyl-CoA hydratase-related protein [Methylomirabilota bacterium]|nr:enoyl-CoA hydratase-related protein [Methylomirabilota bacterium]
MTNPIKAARNGAILELTIDRPKANAFDGPTSKALGEALVAYQNDDTLRCAIVTGAGDKFFSGGWDLKFASDLDSDDSKVDYGPGGFAGLTEMWNLTKPVIAALNGMTIGGGWELALACDLVVAADHVRFWMPEVQRGIIAGGGGVLRLPRLLPYNLAMEILLTCRWVEVAEMLPYGLVNRIVPSARLMEAARELADPIAKAAPLAVQATKAVWHSTAHLSVEEAFARVRRGDVPAHERMLRSADYIEGPRAFAEKRDPVFTGR